MIEETKQLLSIYEEGMLTKDLYELALERGIFSMVSARRLRNIISECFAPRYLKSGSAKYLKPISQVVPTSILVQFLLVFTANANRILFDFIIKVYWNRYASGRDSLATYDAEEFVSISIDEGKTQKIWTKSTIQKVSTYLIGSCFDFGLLSNGRSLEKKIQTVRIHEKTILFFSYWLHFQGLGDNSILSHEIWKLFGLNTEDIKEELKRISKMGWLIVQSAGDVVRISWTIKSIEEVNNVIVAE